MKTFTVTYPTNYGIGIIILNSESIEKAIFIAKGNGAWDGFNIEELDTNKEGIVFKEEC